MLIAAEDSNVPCMFISAFGNMWQHPLLNQIANSPRWKKSFHRLCYFNIRIDNAMESPSSACIVSLSHEMQVQHHPCRCNTCDHVMDWNTEGCHEQRNIAISQIAQQLFDDAVPIADASTSTTQKSPDYHNDTDYNTDHNTHPENSQSNNRSEIEVPIDKRQRQRPRTPRRQRLKNNPHESAQSLNRTLSESNNEHYVPQPPNRIIQGPRSRKL